MQLENSFTISASKNLVHYKSRNYGLQDMTLSPTIMAHKSCPLLRLKTTWNDYQNLNLAIGNNFSLGKSLMIS